MAMRLEMSCCVKASIHVMAEDIIMEIRQILAPTDFSESSKQAVASACELAQTFGAKLLLLHVVELPSYPIEGLPPSHLGGTLLEDLEKQATSELAQVLAKEAEVKVVRRVVMGIPYRKIVEVAEAEKVDLIVMATHGRTGLSHLVMGSVAERVVRTAPCPVLTIRPTGGTA
jgi:nucleotide-binding universal stress UspA family protein